MSNKLKLEIILAVLLAGVIGLAYFVTTSKDRTPPVIEFTEDPVYYEGDDTSVLLTGVRATDSIDGDVTNTVVVDHIVSSDGPSITVYYAAKDNSNNVSKNSRTVVVHKIVVPEPQEPTE